MKAVFLIASWIVGVILIGLMMIYALDKEIEIQDNKEKAYQEYIERESLRWKNKLHLMQLVEIVCILRF